jgi:hypothetical protein
VQREGIDLEEDFLTLTSRQNIDYVNLGDYMALVMSEYLKAKATKGAEDRTSQEIGRMMRRQLVKRLFSFFHKCLRMIRAYNFDERLVS